MSKLGLDVLVIDLEFVHTLPQHNRSALLIGSQHTYAWRVYGKGTKPYWYPNTAHYQWPYFISLPNLGRYVMFTFSLI